MNFTFSELDGETHFDNKLQQVRWEDVVSFIRAHIQSLPFGNRPKEILLGSDIPMPDTLFFEVEGVPCSKSDSLRADQIQFVGDQGPSFLFTLGTYPLVPEKTLKILKEHQENLEKSALKIMEQRYPGEKFRIVRRAGCHPEVRRVTETD